MFDFTSPQMIVYGVLTGLVFGFLLQKGGVTRYQVIIGQFLFKDFTVLKVMLTAIVTGAIGIYGMRAMGMDFPLHIKPAAMAPVLVGGLIFGVGMALLGFCPGTGMAALGDGARDAWPGVIGMLVGGGVFAAFYPSIQNGFMKAWTLSAEVAGKTSNKITLAELSHVSTWVYVIGVAVLAIVVFVLIEKFGPKRPARPA